MKTLRFSRNLEETFLTNFCGQVGMAGGNLNLALTCPAGNFIKKDNSNTVDISRYFVTNLVYWYKIVPIDIFLEQYISRQHEDP